MDDNERGQKNRALAEALGMNPKWVEDYREWWYSPAEHLATRIPDFYGSLDACASVLPALYSFWILDFRSVSGELLHYNAHIAPYPPMNPPEDDALGTYHGEGDTRAAALAEATFAWAKATRTNATTEGAT